MSYIRRIVLYDRAMSVKNILNITTSEDSRVENASFELLRQGGCGQGEITLKDDWTMRGGVSVGDWVAMDYNANAAGRWYLGRVEQIEEVSPKGVTCLLQGPSIQLYELFPGGYANQDANAPPHLIAKSDYFTADPDRSAQTWDTVSQPFEVVNLLYNRFVQPRTIATTKLVNEANPAVGLESLVFRSEESVGSIIRGLATHAHGASWGVTQDRVFFFLNKYTTNIATLQEGVNCESFSVTTDQSLIYNSIRITGGYIYNENGGFSRAQWKFINFPSRAQYGERRITIMLPWLRRNLDAINFTDRFFRTYKNPTKRYTVTHKRDTSVELPYNNGLSGMPRPWEGQVTILDKNGTQLARTMFERIHCEFNHVPVFRVTLGPEDPQFSVPSELHRWELPTTELGPGGQVPPPVSISISGEGTFPSGTSGVLSSLNPETSPLAGSSAAWSSGHLSSGAESSDATSYEELSSDAESSDAPSSGAGETSVSEAQSSDALSSDESGTQSISSDAACVISQATDSINVNDGGQWPWANTGDGGGDCGLDRTSDSQKLRSNTFNFDDLLPVGKTVVGITAIIKLKAPMNVANGVEDGAIQISTATSGKSSDARQLYSGLWPTGSTEVSIGGDSDTWGENWITDDFFNAQIRVDIFQVLQDTASITINANIDSVKLRVCYDPSS